METEQGPPRMTEAIDIVKRTCCGSDKLDGGNTKYRAGEERVLPVEEREEDTI